MVSGGSKAFRAGLCLLVAAVGTTVVTRARSRQVEHRPSRPEHVTIDAGQRFQTIDGFGSSVRLFDDPHLTETHDPATGNGAVVLTTAQEDEILDRLYVDLGLTRIRPATDRGIEPENDNSNPHKTRLDKFNFAGRRNDGFVEYVKRARQRGASVFFLSPLRTESWLPAGPDGVDEYCEWALAVIRRWRELGVELPYYSVLNEPSRVLESPQRAGEFERDVIKRLGPRLRAEGLQTQFVVTDDIGPHEAYVSSSLVLADQKARPYVGALATHLYRGEDLSELAALSAQFGLPLWMTEFHDGDPVRWATLMAELITRYNVSAIDYMWGFFGDWDSAQLISLHSNGPRADHYNPSEGPVYRGSERRKVYYAFGQFSRFVKPGARRVASASPDPELKVAAFTQTGHLVIVAVNARSEPIRVTFDLKGFRPDGPVTAIRTSEAENWAALPDLSSADSAFAAELPVRSTTTFVVRGMDLTSPEPASRAQP